MPQAQNITVKNATNVDKLFTLVTPAAGDASAAVWQHKDGNFPAVYPTLTMITRRAKNGTRTATMRYQMPSSVLDPVNGLPVVTGSPLVKVEVVIPKNYNESLRDDNITLALNIAASSLMKSALRDAFPLT